MNEQQQSNETQQILEDLRSKGREVRQLTEQLSHEQTFQAGLLAEMAILEKQCTTLEKENEVLRRNHEEATTTPKLQEDIAGLQAVLQDKDQKVVTAREALGKIVSAMGCSLSDSGAFVSREDELRTTVESKKSLQLKNAEVSLSAWGTMEMKALAEARYLQEEGQKAGFEASTTFSSMARSIRELRDQGAALGKQRDLLKTEVASQEQSGAQAEHPLMAEERALLQEIESMQSELVGMQEEQRQAEIESRNLREENAELEKEKTELVHLMAHQDVDWESEAKLRHANLEKARLIAEYDKELNNLQEKLRATAGDNEILHERLAVATLSQTGSAVSSPGSQCSLRPTPLLTLTGSMASMRTISPQRSFSPQRLVRKVQAEGSPPRYCPVLGSTLLGASSKCTSSLGSLSTPGSLSLPGSLSFQPQVGAVSQSTTSLFLSGGSSASSLSSTQRPLLSGPGGGAPRPPITMQSAQVPIASQAAAARQSRSMTPSRASTPTKLRTSTPPGTPTRRPLTPSRQQHHSHCQSPNTTVMRDAATTPNPAAHRQSTPPPQHQQPQPQQQQWCYGNPTSMPMSAVLSASPQRSAAVGAKPKSTLAVSGMSQRQSTPTALPSAPTMQLKGIPGTPVGPSKSVLPSTPGSLATVSPRRAAVAGLRDPLQDAVRDLSRLNFK